MHTAEVPYDRINAAQLSTLAQGIRHVNAIRPDELIEDGAERFSIAGAAEFLNEHPESVRSIMGLLKLRYVQVVDGIGFIDSAAVVSIARWLAEQDQNQGRDR